jgi:hypothetical protein
MENFIKAAKEWEIKFGRRSLHENELSSIDNLNYLESPKIKWDIKKYYSIFSGMNDSEYDDKLFSFWNYKKAMIKSQESLYFSNRLWPFADYAYNLNIYAFSYEAKELKSVYLITGREVFKIAKNLDVFFKIFLANPEEIQIF